MDSYKRGELAKVILLLAVGTAVVASVCVAPGLGVIFKHLNAKNTKERYRVKRALTLMESQGVLIRQIENGKEVLVVTEKGQKQAWSVLQENIKIKRPSKWDKRWRIVMFDIPEEKKLVRREVSYKIKNIGMEAIQDSVFASPFPCRSEVDKIAVHYNVRKFFIYLEADTIVLEQDLMKKFGLK